MAKIKISDLHPAGSEFFSDSETYLNDLGEAEIGSIYGGSSYVCGALISVQVTRLAVQSGQRCAKTASYVISAIGGAISAITD